VTSEPPLNLEVPLEVLDRSPTPRGVFYRRSNFPVPTVDSAAWRLRVEGEVEELCALSMDELRRLPPHEVVCTLECAGNGRSMLDPLPPGEPWGLGAVSTARFAGARLRDLLARVRPRSGAVEVLFTGADSGEVEPGRSVSFARSLPLAAAHEPDVLLAWEMDGRPLAPRHGFPLRLVVPGWYGMASVKWLASVRLVAEPFRGHFQAEKYVYLGERGTPEGTPVGRTRVRAVLAHPAAGAEVAAGTVVELRGTAWSGAGAVARVEVSADGGASWADAELAPPPSPHAAAPWRARWTPPEPGRYTLAVRATDTAGNVQPLEPVWNALGYGNHAVQRVRVRAV
jgi:DMSO/TMAO reductase YedYZ molybdopterin-dependent catalytic subunit